MSPASPLGSPISHPPDPPLNCSMGWSSDMVSASRWVWASRRPGKVRKAPSMEPRTASPTRMASLARGNLRRRDRSGSPRPVSTLLAGHSLPLPPLPSQDSRPVPALCLQNWLQVLGHTGQAWRRQGEGWGRVDSWELRAYLAPLLDVLCSPRRNVLAAAMPCARHKDHFVL